MTKVTDKNRDQIIEEYASQLIDGMDWDTLYTFAYEQLVQSKDLMDNEPLENEILDFCPNILGA
jgi:hypothetical protein